jgi:hypothetical protein
MISREMKKGQPKSLLWGEISAKPMHSDSRGILAIEQVLLVW